MESARSRKRHFFSTGERKCKSPAITNGYSMIYLMNVTIGQCSDRTFANRRPAFLFFLVDDPFDDSEGACKSGYPESVPQAQNCRWRRRRHQRGEQAGEAV